MRAFVCVLLLTLSSLTLAAPAPFAQPERRSDSDLPRLQGTWEREAAYLWGDDGWEQVRLTEIVRALIRGYHVVWSADAVLTSNGTFSLCGGTPRGINFLSKREDDVERQCIYHFDGDTLTIIYPKRGAPRPASLDRGYIKLIFHRKR